MALGLLTHFEGLLSLYKGVVVFLIVLQIFYQIQYLSLSHVVYLLI